MGELAGGTGRIAAQENGGGKGYHVSGPEGEENNAKDDWSSHQPDMRRENWSCPQGIQAYCTIRGKFKTVSEAWRREGLHIRWGCI